MFTIGVPRERKDREGRVGMTPEGVREVLMIDAGIKVFIEQGAGVLAGFTDQEYADAGAVITSEPQQIYGGADLVVKIKEPIPQEYALLKLMCGKTLFTYLHLAGVDAMLTETLLRDRVNAIAYENVEQVLNEHRFFPLLVPMSKIAGTQSMRQALLRTPNAHTVVIGGGVVGEAALLEAIAKNAASVVVFEMRKERINELRTSYASRKKSKDTKVSVLSMETMQSSRGRAILAHADAVVSGVMNPGGSEAPKVLTVKEFALMKRGCYIVDVAIDQGGSTEWSRSTHPGETFEREGLIFSCVANIPGATVPREATLALTNATLPYVKLFAVYAKRYKHLPEWWVLKNHHDMRLGLQTWKGFLVNRFVSMKHSITSVYKPLDSFFEL